MPIEVRELIIRATVDQAGEERRGEKAEERDSREAIVEQCVEQILEILRRREER